MTNSSLAPAQADHDTLGVFRDHPVGDGSIIRCPSSGSSDFRYDGSGPLTIGEGQLLRVIGRSVLRPRAAADDLDPLVTTPTVPPRPFNRNPG